MFLTPKSQFKRTFPNTNPRLQDQIQDFPFYWLGWNPTYEAPNGLAFVFFVSIFGRISFIFYTPLIQVSFVFTNGVVCRPGQGQGGRSWGQLPLPLSTAIQQWPWQPKRKFLQANNQARFTSITMLPASPHGIVSPSLDEKGPSNLVFPLSRSLPTHSFFV